ncbi:MAG TPA: YceI family protein [Ignavibacteria bacterium]|nr:YceI family protein [Ignavibacteria bacterium]
MKKLTLIPVLSLLLMAFVIGCGSKTDATKTTQNTSSGETKSVSNTGTSVAVNSGVSVIKWVGKKVTGQHDGTINLKNGQFTVENGKLTGGQFDIDMNTLTVNDIKDAETNAKLLGHLKSDDFFSVDKFPVSTFKITKLAPATEGGNYMVTGDLTIKGITKPITFPANVTINGNSVTTTANFDIDRTEFDIRYGSGKFFEGLGDKMINDNFNLTLDVKSN